MSIWLDVPLLAAHLICMNVASAGPVVCVWLERRALRGDELAQRAARRLASASFVTLALGAVLGLAVGLLRWSPEYRAILERLAHKIYWSGWELLFSQVLLGVYAAMRPAPGRAWRWFRGGLACASSANLLYHFPSLLAIVSYLASRRAEEGPIDRQAFLGLLVQGEVLARVVHFGLASFAIVGTYLIFERKHLAHGNQADEQRLVTWGSRLAFVTSAVQFPVGLWVLVTSPPIGIHRLIFNDWLSLGAVVSGIFSAFGLLHVLAPVAFGYDDGRGPRRAVQWMLGIVVLMSFLLHRMRV